MKRTNRMNRYMDAPRHITIGKREYKLEQLIRYEQYQSMSNRGAEMRLARGYASDYRNKGKNALVIPYQNGIGVYAG